MANEGKYIITRYADDGTYLGWGGEYYASKKSAQAAADDANTNLESGEYLWQVDTEAAVAEYRAAYGEGPAVDEPAPDAVPEAENDAQESEDVEATEDASDDEAPADE